MADVWQTQMVRCPHCGGPELTARTHIDVQAEGLLFLPAWHCMACGWAPDPTTVPDGVPDVCITVVGRTQVPRPEEAP